MVVTASIEFACRIFLSALCAFVSTAAVWRSC